MHMKPRKLIKKRADQAANNDRNGLNGSHDGIRHRIAKAAYELYEQRGQADGHNLDDWLKAEALESGWTE